jgi:hypothetical protein
MLVGATPFADPPGNTQTRSWQRKVSGSKAGHSGTGRSRLWRGMKSHVKDRLRKPICKPDVTGWSETAQTPRL